MGLEIIELKPGNLWKFFYDLTQIPRPSCHEAKVIEYIKEFAESRNLNYEIDEVGNIIVKKPAVSGRENAKGVILQAHIDMVPQKNNAKKHDFLNDPIETIIDGEWLKANDTTLGADNGIGVAAILAVLDSGNIAHGPLEALFTINEETGMEGAFGLKHDQLKGEILLNLDSEDEGELFIGCAGGIDVETTTTYKEELAPMGIAHDIVVKGLKGGHSGLDINLGRANANKLMGRILWSAHANFPITISSIRGGDLRNAIPREAHAKIIIPEKREQEFRKFFETLVGKIKNEYKIADPDIQIELNPAGAPEMVISNGDTIRIVSMLNASKNGVVRMSDEIHGLVETSLNLAIANFIDGHGEIIYLVRSSVDSAKYAVAEELSALHLMFKCKVEFNGDYPGWNPNNDSAILKIMKNEYQELFNEEPKVMAIHAGLECGIIGGIYPGLDMISFGPTIRFPHSPDEKVKIDTVEKFWKYMVAVIEKIN